MELFSAFQTNEVLSLLKVLAPFIIGIIVLGIAYNIGLAILEAFLNTWVGKLVVLGVLITFAINFWLL